MRGESVHGLIRQDGDVSLPGTSEFRSNTADVIAPAERSPDDPAGAEALMAMMEMSLRAAQAARVWYCIEMDSDLSAVCAVCSMDEVADAYLDRRDDLAYRRLIGESLSADEESELDAMNAALRRAMPNGEPLPAHIQEAIAEVDQLLAS